jgi:hypothetical protein
MKYFKDIGFLLVSNYLLTSLKIEEAKLAFRYRKMKQGGAKEVSERFYRYQKSNSYADRITPKTLQEGT